jgi:peptide subunit release factor 1 (eRF1)
LARDIIPHPLYGIVTATGTPSLRAMELIVKEKRLKVGDSLGVQVNSKHEQTGRRPAVNSGSVTLETFSAFMRTINFATI